jgi:hypothetical protein
MAAVRLRLFAVCEFHASGFAGGDDLLAASTGPSTTASPALTDNGRIVGEIRCYDVGPWEDGIADDVLESVAVDFDAMRAAGAV